VSEAEEVSKKVQYQKWTRDTDSNFYLKPQQIISTSHFGVTRQVQSHFWLQNDKDGSSQRLRLKNISQQTKGLRHGGRVHDLSY